MRDFLVVTMLDDKPVIMLNCVFFSICFQTQELVDSWEPDLVTRNSTFIALMAFCRRLDRAICYVLKRTLESLEEKVKKGEDITMLDVTEVTSPTYLADDDIMVPVDLRGVEEVFQSVDEMVVS